jgi:prevent-host-death family protein
MTQVDIQQAKERLSELIERAVRGEEVVISQDDRPLVKLAHIAGQRRPRQFGSAKGLITMTEDFDDFIENFRMYV